MLKYKDEIYFSYEVRMGKAFLILDMLNEYVDDKGNEKVHGASELIPNILMLRDTFEDEDVPIYYANSVLPESEAWAAEIYPSLKPHSVDHIIAKNKSSAFKDTSLESELKAVHVKSIYISGVATEAAVYQTAIDAIEKGFKVEIIDDAIAGCEETSLKAVKTLDELQNAGVKVVCTMKVLDDHILLTAI
jgi:nicotinamidase-related amidase